MELVNVTAGQCYLEFTSTSLLTLRRKNGKYIPLVIGGVLRAKQIPVSEPTVDNAGLAATTDHYVYAYDNGGALALEVVTTGYVVGSNGYEVKSGDESRTLVGFARTGAGTPGVFQVQGLGTLSWFNRKRISQRSFFTANRTTTSATYVEINAEIRVNFVTWADEEVFTSLMGRWQNGSSNGSRTSVGFDGTTPEDCVSGSGIGGQGDWPIGISLFKTGLSEGVHFATLLGATGGGTANWYGNATLADRCSVDVAVQG